MKTHQLYRLLPALVALSVSAPALAQDDKPAVTKPSTTTTTAPAKPAGKPLGKPGLDPNTMRPDPSVVNPTPKPTPQPVTKPTATKPTGPVGKPESAKADETVAPTSDPITTSEPTSPSGPAGPVTTQPPAVTAATNANIPPKAAQKAKDVVEKVGKGTVNWTRQTIEVTGASAISLERFPNKAQARLMAIQGAKADAYRNLLATIKGVDVNSETTVEDMITTSDYINTRVNGFVKGAQQIGQAKEVDGAMEVRMRVELYGTNGLSNVVYDGLEKMETNHSSDAAVNTNINTDLGKGITPEVAASLQASGPGAGEKQVAFNLVSGKLDPQLFPVFVNNKGEVVLNSKVLYDTEKGQFPQLLQLGKDVMNNVGFKQGADVIDIIQNNKGQFVLPTKSEGKWGNVLDWASRIGKTLLMFTPLSPMVK